MEVDEEGRDNKDGEEEDRQNEGDDGKGEEEDMPDDLNLDNAQEVSFLKSVSQIMIPLCRFRFGVDLLSRFVAIRFDA